MHSIPNIPDTLSRAIYADLCTYLSPPPDDTPDAVALHHERAMTAVAHLLPENAAEAEVAVLIVAAQFQARDALRAAARCIPASPRRPIPTRTGSANAAPRPPP
jgi:hypothetical protein